MMWLHRPVLTVHRSICAIAVVVLLAACSIGDNSKGDDELKDGKQILRREWTYNAEFAGDLMAEQVAESLGFHLEVREGNASTNVIQDVRTGLVDYGVASAERVLNEIAEGGGLVVLATATARTPVIWMSRPGTVLRSVKDFVGRRVAIQSGTSTELITRWLLAKGGVKESQVKLMDAGWAGMDDLLRPKGDLDIVAAFAYDEPVTLRRKGVTPVVLSAKQAGLDLVGTVYFTRKELVEKRPAAVQAFMRALVGGWRRAQKDPEAALTLLMKKSQGSGLSLEKERESLRLGMPYFISDSTAFLRAPKERWEATAAMLRQLAGLKQFDFDQAVDYRFLLQAMP